MRGDAWTALRTAALALMVACNGRAHHMFERLPDGTLLWRASAVGHDEAMRKLQGLTAKGCKRVPSNASGDQNCYRRDECP